MPYEYHPGHGGACTPALPMPQQQSKRSHADQASRCISCESAGDIRALQDINKRHTCSGGLRQQRIHSSLHRSAVVLQALPLRRGQHDTLLACKHADFAVSICSIVKCQAVCMFLIYKQASWEQFCASSRNCAFCSRRCQAHLAACCRRAARQKYLDQMITASSHVNAENAAILWWCIIP